MAAVQVNGRHILGGGREVKVGIEPIARLEDEVLSGLYMSDWLHRI